ncbi:hypothetical protein H6G96_27730 [Nostoc sp. FACHB-892]|uniref:hypothetical protein n=1 Tax=Nostoc sp. FACHB-892 TaxID=2692843 RepID=UPI0016887DCC|nr:hypothetical protein [Nostoc sp. FACHB-892]MBD2730007.1 hypothetical protein [Nostoc sp. FACHB-892]
MRTSIVYRRRHRSQPTFRPNFYRNTISCDFGILEIWCCSVRSLTVGGYAIAKSIAK